MLAAFAVTIACRGSSSEAVPARLVERSQLAMGSALKLSAWTTDESLARVAFDAVFAEFERLEGLLSVWRDGSDVVRINAAAGRHAVQVGPDVRTVLRAARQVSGWTNGKFDVTFGPLADVWKFDHDQDNTVPAPKAIHARLGLIDYTAVEVDDARESVFLRRSGMRIHLGGIGKGYAVDRARDILRARGIRDFMIQVGGDLYVGGLQQGRPWRVGVADPRDPTKVFGSLDLSDGTLSTSGDYERSFIKDGRRYHHLIDPDLGQPARGCRSVTIVAKSPILADGLSTGVFIMGPTAGMALIERLPDVEGIIVSDANEVVVSSGLQNVFTLRAPPTDGT
jgi:thiamine biosynthesis lipoprotein